MGTDSPFAVLGVPEDCTTTELTRAFRAAARRTHPDHGGDAAAFRRVVAAYRAACRTRRASGAAGDPYRAFLTGLDAAARLPVRPVTVVAPVPPRAAPPVPPSAARFARVLAEVLAAA